MTAEEQAVRDKLLRDFPTFVPHWEKERASHAAYFGDDEEFDPGIYQVARMFANFIVDSYQAGDYPTVKQAFLEIEHLAQSESAHISNAALVGFVEDVLFIRSHRKIPLNAFDEWLSEGTRQFWYGMHNFYTTGEYK